MQLVSSLAIVAAMAISAHTAAVATPPIIDTPVGATQCVPTELIWNGGAVPFSLEVLREVATDPDSAKSIINESGQIIGTLAGLTGQSFIWSTNIPGGDVVGIQLRDSTGAVAETALFEVLASADRSCL